MQNDFLDILVEAIARQEGYFAGNPQATLVVRNNPGNLRFAGQANASRPTGATAVMIGQGEPIAVFSSPQAGICALYRDELAKIASGMSLRAMIYAYAPPNENNTAVYLANVQQGAGIADPDVPLIYNFKIASPK